MGRVALWFLSIVPCALGLSPRPVPSGGSRWYTPNPARPSRDLEIVTASEASFINRQWLCDILEGGIPPEDVHVVEAINRFEQYLQDHSSDVHMVWTPSGCAKDVLSLTSLSFNDARDQISVRHIVQSPYWDPSQIDSMYLKAALTDLACQCAATVDFDPLYRSNDRYRLAWDQWPQNAGYCFANENLGD